MKYDRVSGIPLRSCLFATSVAFLSACHDHHHHHSGQPVTPEVTLVEINVTPDSPSVPLGVTQSFSAFGVYSDETLRDLTGSVVWQSSDSTVATVDDREGSKGLATALAVGSTTITAVEGTISGSTLLTVTDPILVNIAISPLDPTVVLGEDINFKATGILSDGSTSDLTAQVAWGTSNAAVAVFDGPPQNGHLRTVGVGSANITATLGSLTSTTTLTVNPVALVSIAVTPTNPSIVVGTTQQFQATGTFNDNSTRDLTQEVAWSSSDTAVAAISNVAGSRGRAAGNAQGSSTIRAVSGSLSGSTTLTVTPAVLVSITVTPVNPSIALGTGVSFTATGVFNNNATLDLTSQATWSSSDTRVATVSNAAGSKGVASTLETGSTTITAAFDSKTGASTLTVTPAVVVSIAVTPTNPSVALGTKQQFQATGTFTDNSNQDLTAQVSWSSSTTGVATVSNDAGSKGLATTLATGSSTITATLGQRSGSTTLTVTPKALRSITVSPANPSIALGTTQAFRATGTYSDDTTQDLTEQVAWSSSDPEVAAISNAAGSKGLATSISIGSTSIGAAMPGVSGSTTLTVTQKELRDIVVTPANPTIALGTNLAFRATGNYTDQSSQDLTEQATWTSVDTAVAIISNAAGSKGLASAVGAGSTTIRAALGAVTGSTTLTVSSTPPVRIDVTPVNPFIIVAATQRFTATGFFSDATTQDLTTQVTWSSSDDRVATISNAVGSKGLATGVAVGSTTIRAALGAVSGSTTLNISGGVELFRRCDPNLDSRTDIADGVLIIQQLFYSRPPTVCMKSADCNDDAVVQLADAVHCFNYQLQNGPAPRPPFPGCGTDPSTDSLTCESYTPCGN